MTCNVSGRVVYPVAAGTLTGLPTKKIYIKPSRDDFEFSMNGGTLWQPWEGDPANSQTYPGAVTATTNSTGDWGFLLPWTDDPLETRLPGGALVPDLYWNIIDPNPITGVRVIYGKLPSAVVSTSKTTKELITLASPNTWQVGSVIYNATPSGTRRYVSMTFTPSSPTAGFTMPNIGTSAWKFTHGVESDDATKTYAPIVDTTTKTSVSGNVRLSDVPPSGKVVTVHLEIYP
ncbi:MAG: hypothetical protein E6Q97_36260 [Desulfurellales bacterium]|nr:MAG: hypothetical protein E6Q97_36260 [Desulfurellales bacterium]